MRLFKLKNRKKIKTYLKFNAMVAMMDDNCDLVSEQMIHNKPKILWSKA